MENILSIIKDRSLTYHQKVLGLAGAAEDSIDVLDIDKMAKDYLDRDIICDLYEGHAPYRPRYIAPDYEKFMEKGSEFLDLERPKDIWEAVNNLLILYKHVPSITSFPVYIGNIDYLLDPFIEDKDEAYKAIKFFLTHIDRTVTDSFCHANIGPKYTEAGRIILKVQRELKASIPNISLKYDEEITSNDFAIDSIETGLMTAKPSFANHKMFAEEFGEDYCIASCYNGLPIGGGSYTLVRLNLFNLAKEAKNEEDFLENILPVAVDKMSGYMDERIKFLVEESNFFETNFLVKEDLIHRDRFTAMFGMYGLAEAVNHILQAEEIEDRFGHGERANKLGYAIVEKLDEENAKHKNPYCEITDEKFLLHSQVGIDTDEGTSPGCRIPIGEEPEIHEHLLQAAKFHKFFPSGIGDIFTFDETVDGNPSYLLDLINGSFEEGMRYISFYSSDCDVIRITGYLVKKSEMEKLDRGEQVVRNTVAYGLGAAKNQKVLERKVRKNGSSN